MPSLHPTSGSNLRTVRVVVGVLLALLLTACGGGDQPGTVSWRNITMDVPDGWYVTDQADTRLTLSNQPIGAETDPADIDGPVVAMNFTYDPSVGPADVRRFVEEQDATLETDQALELGGEVPATQVVYSYETLGTPTREMYVVIPSRQVVLLAQPVPRRGDTDAPEVFLEYIETFLEVLDTARFGSPVLD